MQNEILKVMALNAAPFVNIMVDETTNISNKEQVVICFQWVNNKLEAHEDFYWFVQDGGK